MCWPGTDLSRPADSMYNTCRKVQKTVQTRRNPVFRRRQSLVKMIGTVITARIQLQNLGSNGPPDTAVGNPEIDHPSIPPIGCSNEEKPGCPSIRRAVELLASSPQLTGYPISLLLTRATPFSHESQNIREPDVSFPNPPAFISARLIARVRATSITHTHLRTPASVICGVHSSWSGSRASLLAWSAETP